MYVALDSNILLADPWLRSQKTRQLLDFVKKTQSKVLLHEVVEAEVRANFRRQCSDAIMKIEKDLSKAERYDIVGIPEFNGNKSLDVTLAKFDENFNNVLDNWITIRVPLNNTVLSEVIRRALERIPPCSGKGEEIRDAIIWLNLLEFCKKYDHKIAFISANTNEFADSNTEILRAELLEDIKNYEINLSYFKSLDYFLKKHAEPVAHITSEWIRARLDTDKVEHLISENQKSGAHISKISNYYKICKIEYRGRYIPIGEPNIYQIDVEFKDFYVWKFDDQHIEISLIFNAYIEADIDCELDASNITVATHHHHHHHHQFVPQGYSHLDTHSHSSITDFDDLYLRKHSHFYTSASHGPYSPNHISHMIRTFTCFAELGFRISAKVIGDELLLLDIEDVYNF